MKIIKLLTMKVIVMKIIIFHIYKMKINLFSKQEISLLTLDILQKIQRSNKYLFINEGISFEFFYYMSFVLSWENEMEHLFHASYAGGILIEVCCSSHWAAIVIGFLGGSISILFIWRIKTLLHWSLSHICNIRSNRWYYELNFFGQYE